MRIVVKTRSTDRNSLEPKTAPLYFRLSLENDQVITHYRVHQDGPWKRVDNNMANLEYENIDEVVCMVDVAEKDNENYTAGLYRLDIFDEGRPVTTPMWSPPLANPGATKTPISISIMDNKRIMELAMCLQHKDSNTKYWDDPIVIIRRR